MLLKELCELSGVSGNEKMVREYILSHIKENVHHYQIDSIGNLLVEKKSLRDGRPKVVLCAHMDEVGLFITEITSEGYLKFQPVGGIDPRILISKTISMVRTGMMGVIGSKAIHLQKKEERKQVQSIDELYIDIGANSKEEAEKEIRLGDYAVFNSTFEIIGDHFYKAKALDDRVGCALLIQLLAETFDCHLTAAFTVQEEIGLRGSKVISNNLKADLAIVVEATSALDIQESDREGWIVELGQGPACSLMDSSTIYKPELVKKLIKIARHYDIPLQFRQGTAAANDAANLHRAGGGIPTITLSIPCRNIHSMSSLICKEDYDHCLLLLRQILNHIDQLV